MYPFMTQGLGAGGYTPVQSQNVDLPAQPGAGFYSNVSVGAGGFQGTAIGLLAILGGLVAFYMLTRSIQGSR